MTKPIRPFGHPTPWQRIVEACGKGVGIRLSWEELQRDQDAREKAYVEKVLSNLLFHN